MSESKLPPAPSPARPETRRPPLIKLAPFCALALILTGGVLVLVRRDQSRLPTPPAHKTAQPAPPSPPQSAAGTLSPTSVEEIARLREQLNRNPQDLSTRLRLAVALDSRGEASEAEDVLRFALQRGQKKPEVYHALGMLYLRNRIYHGAVEAFLAEIQLAPKNFRAHLNLAQTYYQLEMPEESLREFEIARKLDPSVPDTYLGLAFLNNTNERYPYAVRYLQDFIQRSPQPGPGYALLSRVYLNMREYDKAVEAGRKATQAMPDSASSWYNLGQAYSYQPGNKNLTEAAAAFERATQLLANYGGAHFELGRVYERMGRTADAIAQYREAVRCFPNQGKYRYQLGRLLKQQGQIEEGQREIERSERLIRLNQREMQLTNKIKASPADPRPHYELGLVYQALGELAKAKAAFEAALQRNPNYAEARARWAEVRQAAASAR